MRPTHAVAVVGAGPGGLVAARYLRQAGFAPTLFDGAAGVGGQWRVGAPHSKVWPGMRANSSRVMTAFSDLPHRPGTAVYPAAASPGGCRSPPIRRGRVPPAPWPVRRHWAPRWRPACRPRSAAWCAPSSRPTPTAGRRSGRARAARGGGGVRRRPGPVEPLRRAPRAAGRAGVSDAEPGFRTSPRPILPSPRPRGARCSRSACSSSPTPADS
jgi:hypothetical protein